MVKGKTYFSNAREFNFCILTNIHYNFFSQNKKKSMHKKRKIYIHIVNRGTKPLIKQKKKLELIK